MDRPPQGLMLAFPSQNRLLECIYPTELAIYFFFLMARRLRHMWYFHSRAFHNTWEEEAAQGFMDKWTSKCRHSVGCHIYSALTCSNALHVLNSGWTWRASLPERNQPHGINITQFHLCGYLVAKRRHREEGSFEGWGEQGMVPGVLLSNGFRASVLQWKREPVGCCTAVEEWSLWQTLCPVHFAKI